MFTFLLHCLALTGLSYASARRIARHSVDRYLATFALVWGNIVMNCLLLSELHRLGSEQWFLRTSLVLAVLTLAGVRLFAPEPAPADEPAQGADRMSRLLLLAFVATLAPLAYASIRIAATYIPNNYDSLTYHLPRAMIYMGQQTLGHFATGNDRQIYFPFNYNLLQLWGLIYSPPLQLLNFINLVCWVTAGLAIYRLARLAGAGANASLLASWIALSSTQILAQATATTNDLPTGAILLGALLYGLRWCRTRRRRDALTAGLAAGLAVGSKLTVIFFAPAGGLIVLVLAWQAWRTEAFAGFLRGARAWALPALLAVVLAAPFAVINLVYKSQWQTQEYDYTLNRPFAVASVVQTTKAYLVQLFLEPIHRFTIDQKFTEQLNDWGSRTLFPHWNSAYAFSPFYLFPPDLNEDHVWFGFAGPALLLCALAVLLVSRRFSAPAVWLAGLGSGWLATYFILNKWSLYNQRYFVLAMLVMAPCAAVCLEAARSGPLGRRLTRDLVAALLVSATWMAGIYLFHNTSRPFAPLWARRPAPPAVPALPPLLAQRMAEQPLVNFDSTDGNERAFLLMGKRPHQRFIAKNRVVPDRYNVFSEWGFPRKVAYSNIEQKSSYTIVKFPGKATAGIEYLGTIGSGQPALDYYGLRPHPETTAATDGDRNVLVHLYYKAREPGRYSAMRVKVAGLNAPDHARLQFGIEYADGRSETLATFASTGDAPVSITRPFRRFIVTLVDQDTGARLGGIDIPYLYRNLPPEIEAPDDATLLFADELIVPHPEQHISTTGLDVPEGPYPQWKLPLIRWCKAPVLRMEIPETDQLQRLALSFGVRLEARDRGDIDLVLNGRVVHTVHLQGSASWADVSLNLTPAPGRNVIELRNVTIDREPDWQDYLENNPDVKQYVLSQGAPLEQGARAHYEQFGRHETRPVHFRHRTETLPGSAQLYFLFRSIRIDGYRTP